jgi:hypothetical protein
VLLAEVPVVGPRSVRRRPRHALLVHAALANAARVGVIVCIANEVQVQLPRELRRAMSTHAALGGRARRRGRELGRRRAAREGKGEARGAGDVEGREVEAPFPRAGYGLEMCADWDRRRRRLGRRKGCDRVVICAWLWTWSGLIRLELCEVYVLEPCRTHGSHRTEVCDAEVSWALPEQVMTTPARTLGFAPIEAYPALPDSCHG